MWLVVTVNLLRRRAYPLALAEQRAQELEETLQELQSTQAFLQRLLTAGPVAVLRVGMPARQIQYVSPNVEKVLGVTEQESFAIDAMRNLVLPEHLPTVLSALGKLEEGSSKQELIEFQITRREHGPRWLSAVLTTDTDADARVVAVLIYVLDVDERHRSDEARQAAQAQAEEANKAKSQFLSRMSHELRTPLNAILGFGQLLEIEELTEGQRDSVDHILKGGRHLLDLINEVLDIARIEAGEISLSTEAVSSSDLIQDAVDLMRPLADQRSIHLVVDTSGGSDGYVFADRQRSKQVLLNLLSNAIKYNRSQGTVSISSQQTMQNTLRLIVADTGPGIPAERLGMLFTPFERLGAEHTTVEGSGIGLALSKRLSEAMGGTLEATSRLGHGSTFTLELPSVEGPVKRYERLERRIDSPSPIPVPSHILLHIEDNLANLTLVERVMARRPNVQVMAAMHGRLALELARQHRPAIILLDMHLPDMNGEQVLLRLRDDPITSSIPVVIISADATPGQVRRLLSAGAAAYLTKPFNIPELLQLIDNAIPQP